MVFDLKAGVAEMVAMTLFITFGCGTAAAYGASDAETRFVVAFAFGIGILVLAYSVGHLSGGQINGAVTFSLVLGGALPWYQGVLNVFFQLVGSIIGSLFVVILIPCGMDQTTNLASNIVNPKYGYRHALMAEIIGTFLLCKVVWEAALSPNTKAGPSAAIAIGFSVFLAHLFMLPIDGCSINPTRSFGPPIVAHLRGCANYTAGGLQDLWVMWVGPLIGGAFAAALARYYKQPSVHAPLNDAGDIE